MMCGQGPLPTITPLLLNFGQRIPLLRKEEGAPVIRRAEARPRTLPRYSSPLLRACPTKFSAARAVSAMAASAFFASMVGRSR